MRYLASACLVAAVLAVTGLLALPSSAQTSVQMQNNTGPTGTYQLDPPHTSVYFSIEHLGISRVFGRFNEVKGTITLGRQPSLEVTIPVASIDTGVDKRDQHLRSPDFFDARQHPTMSFKSTRIQVEAENNITQYTVTGDLTLHGQTHEVTFELDYQGTATQNGKEKVGFGGELTLDRTKWGVDGMVGAVGKDVNLYLQFEAIAQ